MSFIFIGQYSNFPSSPPAIRPLAGPPTACCCDMTENQGFDPGSAGAVYGLSTLDKRTASGTGQPLCNLLHGRHRRNFVKHRQPQPLLQRSDLSPALGTLRLSTGCYFCAICSTAYCVSFPWPCAFTRPLPGEYGTGTGACCISAYYACSFPSTALIRSFTSWACPEGSGMLWRMSPGWLCCMRSWYFPPWKPVSAENCGTGDSSARLRLRPVPYAACPSSSSTCLPPPGESLRRLPGRIQASYLALSAGMCGIRPMDEPGQRGPGAGRMFNHGGRHGVQSSGQ